MQNGKYTNDIYIPLGKLETMDSNIFDTVRKFREVFVQIITFNNNFLKMIETPELVKKRFIKNVELSKMLDITVEDNDFVLELAKQIVEQKPNLLNIPKEDKDKIIKLFKKEGNDLTIVTTWLVNNIDKYLYSKVEDNIRHAIPALTKKDELFIQHYNETNKYYSISDYMKESNCSYETARSAFERLTTLELFNKNKQGKRFIYRPTIKLQAIIKGGI